VSRLDTSQSTDVISWAAAYGSDGLLSKPPAQTPKEYVNRIVGGVTIEVAIDGSGVNVEGVVDPRTGVLESAGSGSGFRPDAPSETATRYLSDPSIIQISIPG
jgi:hypothetical protein